MLPILYQIRYIHNVCMKFLKEVNFDEAVDMYIDECLKEININQLQSNELDLVKILEEQNESSRNEENGYIWVLCTCIMFLSEYKFFWNR